MDVMLQKYVVRGGTQSTTFVHQMLQKLDESFWIVQKQVNKVLGICPDSDVKGTVDHILRNDRAVAGFVVGAQFLQELRTLIGHMLYKDLSVLLHVVLGFFEIQIGDVVKNFGIFLVVFDLEFDVPVVFFVFLSQDEGFGGTALSKKLIYLFILTNSHQ